MSLLAFDKGLVLSSLVMGIVSGLVPFVNIEVYLAGVAALSTAEAVPVIVMTTIGQMLAKAILYQSGRGAVKLPLGRAQAPIQKATQALQRHPGRSMGLVLFSAVTGLPPFYGMSIAAGMLRLSFASFMTVGTFGRLFRFSVVFLLPRVLMH